MEVPVGDQAGAEGAQRVGALHAQHRPAVGVAEVVQAVVVGHRVAGDVVAGLGVADVAARAADDDGHLALVVQPLAVRRPHHRGAVRVQRADRLVEVRGCRRQRHAELLHAADVVEVAADDLRRLDRRQVHGVVDGDGAAVARDQRVAVAQHDGGIPVEQDPADVGHGVPFRRPEVVWGQTIVSPHDCDERVHLPSHRTGRGVDAAAHALALQRRPLTVEYRTDPSRVAELLPDPLTLVPDDQDPGAVAMIFADWQSCGDDYSELMDPVRSQYKEAFVVVRCMYRGTIYSRCVYIWVDKDFALVRGHFQGYPKKLGSIWQTRPVTIGKAGPRIAAGGRFAGTVAYHDRRIVNAYVTLREQSDTQRLRQRPPDDPLAVHAAHRGRRHRQLHELVTMSGRDVEVGPAWQRRRRARAARPARWRRSPGWRCARSSAATSAGRHHVRRRHHAGGAVSQRSEPGPRRPRRPGSRRPRHRRPRLRT